VYQAETDLLFPIRAAISLQELRGEVWRRLVDRACQAPDASLDELAFCLLMIRLAGCLTCHADSYRALRGCSACARQAVRRFRGTDGDLLALFDRARMEITGVGVDSA
jgi:hypothetical protein